MSELTGAILTGVGRASLEGAVFALAVWGLCKAFPRLPAALRCWLWWAVCVRFLLVLAGVQPFALALLPAPQAAPAVTILQTPSGLTASAPAVTAGGVEPAFRTADALRWGGGLLAALWLAGALAALLGTAGQLREARRILRRSHPVREGGLVALFADLGGRLGVRRSELRLSEDIRTPQVIGLWKPRVLLPHPGAGRLSRPELTMTLCHELLHVRRLDLWLGWLPALVQRLFFFHPLARLAAREYALAREAACDAGVLRWLGAAPAAYGDLLLRLGVVPRGAALAAAGASPSFQNLKRRLEMLQNLSETDPSSRVRWTRWGLWTLAGTVALAALIPVRITAAEAEKTEKPPVEPVPAVAAVEAVPAPPAPPVPPKKSHSYSYRTDGGDSYMLRIGDNIVMSGWSDDISERTGDLKGDLLWLRRNGRDYVVRDAALLQEAQRIIEPQMRLGRQQGELGAKQGALGAEQGRLGGRQGALGARQGALAAQQAALSLREGKSGQDLDAEMEELQRKMEDLGEQQEELGRQQEDLGRKQEALGEQQEALGRQQEEASRQAGEQLKSLMDQALAKGLAQEVR